MRCKAAVLKAAQSDCSAFPGTACNAAARRIGVIPKGTAHVFWQSVHAGAEAAGREFHEDIGGRVRRTRPITPAARDLRFDAEPACKRDRGGGSDRTTLNASLDRASRENIPVVVFDSGWTQHEYVSFVATNNYEGGQMAAQKLG